MLRVILAIVSIAWVAPPLLGHDWPQWRGPRANGVGEVSGAPERWSKAEGVLWRADIEGYGIPSPVIVGDRVHLTMALPWQGRSVPRLVCDSLVGLLALSAAALLTIYAVRSNGTTCVIAVEDTFRLISESSLEEEMLASPAFAAGRLFLRTATALYCMGNRS